MAVQASDKTVTVSGGEDSRENDDGRRRFLLELEFVQLLANPTYIHYLAQNRYLEDPAFVSYLKYLQYWRRPEYARFIMYPHGLFFLELLQSANFRSAMAHPGPKELAHRQQFYFWRHYRNNRLKLLQEQAPPPLARRNEEEEGLKKEGPSQRPTSGNGLVESESKIRQTGDGGLASESKKRKGMS